MTASYPVSIKVFTVWRNFADPTNPPGDTIFANHVNELHDEIVAIETVVGTNPQGAAASVSARIAALESGKSTTGHTHPQYMIPIGAIFLFPQVIGRGNVNTGQNTIFNSQAVWLACDGSTVQTNLYPDLCTFLNGAPGSNATLPNLTNNIPMGAGSTVAMGATAGSTGVTLSVGQLPAHNHPVNDPAHTHHGYGGTSVIRTSLSSTVCVPPAAGFPGAQQVAWSSNDVTTDTTAATVGNTGSGGFINTLSPVLGCAYYIKALTVS